MPTITKNVKASQLFKTDPNLFVNSLVQSGIDTIHSKDNINIEDVVVDGVTYSFEYASKSNYNFYISYNPRRYAEKYIVAQKALVIIKLFEKHFGL